MKKILLAFPLNPTWQLSEKVWVVWPQYKFSDHYLCSHMTMLYSFFSFNSVGLPFFRLYFYGKICHISFDPIYLILFFGGCNAVIVFWIGLVLSISAWQDDDRYFILNVLITGILLQFSEWIFPPPAVLEKFLEFLENALLRKVWILLHYVHMILKMHGLNFFFCWINNIFHTAQRFTFAFKDLQRFI